MQTMRLATLRTYLIARANTDDGQESMGPGRRLLNWTPGAHLNVGGQWRRDTGEPRSSATALSFASNDELDKTTRTL